MTRTFNAAGFTLCPKIHHRKNKILKLSPRRAMQYGPAASLTSIAGLLLFLPRRSFPILSPELARYRICTKPSRLNIFSCSVPCSMRNVGAVLHGEGGRGILNFYRGYLLTVPSSLKLRDWEYLTCLYGLARSKCLLLLFGACLQLFACFKYESITRFLLV